MRASTRVAAVAGLAVIAWKWRDRIVDFAMKATVATNMVTVRPGARTRDPGGGEAA